MKQTYSKEYGQIDKERMGTLTKDPEFEKSHIEKDVLTPRKLPKNINFNYRRNKEPVKTLWQANKDFINQKKQKMNFITYFEKYKSTKKVVEGPNHTTHWYTVVAIMCKKEYASADDIGFVEAIQLIAKGKARILGMQLTMNTDRDKYGTLIKNYYREYLEEMDKYPKTLQGAHNLLK